MARPRKKGRNVPPGVYFGKGRWYYRDGTGETKLADADATEKQVWDACVALRNGTSITAQHSAAKAGTLEWLCDEYLASPRFAKRAPSTRRDYENCKKSVCVRITKDGRVFGTIPAKSITPGVLQRYLDMRGEQSPSRANKEIAFLGVVFAHGYRRELVKDNPARGLEKFEIEPRQRYVTDAEYQAVYDRAPEWLQLCMEFAYLCRLRRGEVIGPDLTDAHGVVVGLHREHVLDEGMRVIRSKGSRTQIITWTPRLKGVVKRALKLPSNPATMKHLIHDKRGQKIRSEAFKSAWGRLMKKAVRETGVKPFTFHDLKRKGVTDAEGDKLQASGHKSASMLAVYDVSVPQVAPTK